MASIDLHLHEVGEKWMPPVCARCGAESRYVRTKTVVWSPWWVPLAALLTGFVIFLPYFRLLISFVAGGSDTNRRVTFHLPFCARHRHHWRWRWWPLVVVLVLSLGLLGGGLAVATQPEPLNEMGLLIAGSGILGLALWGVLAIVLPRTGIRITDLAGTALTLSGVSEPFCRAVAQRRLQGPAAVRDDEEDLPRRRKRQITCPACGARYSQRRPRCPSCGETNDSLGQGRFW
jgi:hypothetical protein